MSDEHAARSRYRFAGREKLPLRFRVFQGHEAQTSVTSVTIDKARLAKIGENGAEEIADLDFHPVGDHFEATLDQAKLADAKLTGILQVIVHYRIASASRSDATDCTLQYTGEIPARFTGVVSDELRDGSLMIVPAMEVEKPGKYEITVRVFSSAGEPLAVGRFVGALEAGRQEPAVEVYGLVFHDARTGGPFEIRTITGTLHDARGTRSRGFEMATLEGPFVTKKYSLDQFTSKEFESPQKTLMANAYKSQIAELEKTNPPSP